MCSTPISVFLSAKKKTTPHSKTKINLDITADCHHCLTFIIGRKTIHIKKTINIKSQAALGHNGTDAGINAKMRAILQNINNTNKTVPLAVDNPVQLVTAVNKKPATTAMVNPNIISCPCQTVSGIVTKIFPPKV